MQGGIKVSNISWIDHLVNVIDIRRKPTAMRQSVAALGF